MAEEEELLKSQAWNDSYACYLRGELGLHDFIWSADLRPHSGLQYNSSLDLPQLDLCNRTIGPQIIPLLSQAARDWGFFRVLNHGVSQELINRLHARLKLFFALDLKQKVKASRSPGDLFGYGCGNASNLENKWWSESLHLFWDQDYRRTNEVLQKIYGCEEDYRGLRDDLLEYMDSVKELADYLRELLSQGLGLEADHFEKYMRPASASSLRVNHYPPCPQPHLTLGVPPHNDPGILTVLHEDNVGGLQVFKDNSWVPLKPNMDSLIVNIGDTFQIFSNDRYKSVLHRAVPNVSASRISLAFFYNPAEKSIVEPVQELCDPNHPPSHRAVSYADYRAYGSKFAKIRAIDYFRNVG